MGGADFGKGSFFGFVGDGKFGNIREGWESALTTDFQEMIGKGGKVGLHGGLDDGGIGLICLDENFGGVEMATADTANYLGKKFKSALFGGEIWQSKAGVGLDNANRSKVRQIKPAGEGLSADEDVDGAGFNIGIEVSKVLTFFVIAIKTGDFGIRKKAGKFGLKEFRTESFVNDARSLTDRAGFGDLFLVAAEVTSKGIAIGMQGHRQITIGAKGLPAAIFTESERRGAAAVMENQSLVVIFEILADILEQEIRKIAIFGKISTIFEVDDSDFGINGGGFGLFG